MEVPGGRVISFGISHLQRVLAVDIAALYTAARVAGGT